MMPSDADASWKNLDFHSSNYVHSKLSKVVIKFLIFYEYYLANMQNYYYFGLLWEVPKKI